MRMFESNWLRIFLLFRDLRGISPRQTCPHKLLSSSSPVQVLINSSLTGSFAIPRIHQKSVLPQGLCVQYFLSLECSFPGYPHDCSLSFIRSLLNFSTFLLPCFIFLHYIYHHLTHIFIVYCPLLKYKLYKLDFICTNVSSTPRIIPIKSPSLFCWPFADVRYICQHNTKHNSK